MLFDITGAGLPASDRTSAFFHQPMITADPDTTQPRDSELENFWWWMKDKRSVFIVTSTRPESPIQTIRGSIQAPACGPKTINLTLAADGREDSARVIANPNTPTDFELTLPGAGAAVATLDVRADGPACQGSNFEWKRYAQVMNLRAY